MDQTSLLPWGEVASRLRNLSRPLGYAATKYADYAIHLQLENASNTLKSGIDTISAEFRRESEDSSEFIMFVCLAIFGCVICNSYLCFQVTKNRWEEMERIKTGDDTVPGWARKGRFRNQAKTVPTDGDVESVVSGSELSSCPSSFQGSDPCVGGQESYADSYYERGLLLRRDERDRESRRPRSEVGGHAWSNASKKRLDHEKRQAYQEAKQKQAQERELARRERKGLQPTVRPPPRRPPRE